MEVLSMRLETDRHLDEEQIERYSLGEIAEEEVSGLEEHLLICESCQSRVTESDTYVSTMQRASARIRRENLKAETGRWFFPRLTPTRATAASVLLLTVAGLWWVNLPAKWRNRVAIQPAFTVNLVATRGSGIEGKGPAAPGPRQFTSPHVTAV